MKIPSLLETVTDVESRVHASINALAQVGSEPLTKQQVNNLSAALANLHTLSISLAVLKAAL